MPKPHLSKKTSNKVSPLSMSSMVKILPPVLLSTMSTVAGFSMRFHRLNTNVNINPKHHNNNFQRRLQRQLYGQVLAPVPRRFSSTTCTMRLNPTSFDGSAMTITDYPMPVLRKVGVDIENFDDKLHRICSEMITIMYQADGVGLAAPQVNLSLQLFVYNPVGEVDKPELERIVCNPKIVTYSDDTTADFEACLSSQSDHCGGPVSRSNRIWVEYQDENGTRTKRILNGFEARVFQHEYDHLQGILHFDRFSPEQRTKIQPNLDVMISDYKEDDGILEPDGEMHSKLLPPPIGSTTGMPPLEDAELVENKSQKEDNPIKKMKQALENKTGFGFGGVKKGKGKGGKKKKKK